MCRPWSAQWTGIRDVRVDGSSQLYRVGLNTTRLLFAVGDLVVAWLLLRQAEVSALDAMRMRVHLIRTSTGKVAAARWFVQQVLPLLSTERALVEGRRTM